MEIRLEDTEKANRAICDGSLKRALDSLAVRIKPEASYFLTSRGKRCALYVFEMERSMAIPMIVEPLITGLNADITFSPCMNELELSEGLQAWMEMRE